MAFAEDPMGSANFPAPTPIRVSFEFFPPGDADMATTLWKSIERLAPLAPRFVSVTYGADGSTRERTHSVVTRIQRETTLVGAPHLTCIGASRGEILDIARRYHDEGIRHVVALRGPGGTTTRVFATSSPCAVTCRRHRRATSRTRTALLTRRISWRDSGRLRISTSRSPHIRRGIRKLPLPGSISTISSARSLRDAPRP